jgi:hypothetical protein
VAAAAAILAVDVDGDGLQVLNQQRLEPHQRVELAPHDREERFDRALRFLVRRDVAVDVLDELCVEAPLRLERRAD